MKPTHDVYRNLQVHLNKMPVGFPATKTGIEINLLKSIFSPEQAKVAAHLGYKPKTVDQIFETAKDVVRSKEELKSILDDTVSKGGISRKEKEGEDQYVIPPLVLWGMYEYQLKRLSKDFLMDFGQYMQGEFGLELATSTRPKMRVIPVEKSIDVKQQVATYDELRHLIDRAGEHIAVQDCMCRKVNDMLGKSCQVTERREVCMSLGYLADLYVKEGWGRNISQEEALEIARKNEEEGLALMSGNAKETTFVCACCGDCCGMLSIMKNFPKPAEVVGSNYYAQVDSELCKGCETCVTRCPIDAVKVKEDKSSVDLARCIGCGLCIPTCSEKAMRLIKKEKEVVPPETEEDLFDEVLAYKQTLKGKIRNSLLKTFIRIASRFSH